MPSYFILFAALNGAIAVAGGAFAAHGLDPVADMRRIGWLKTAADYQLTHAIGLLAVVALKGPRFTLYALSAGILFFAGSLYLMAVTGWLWLGAVTPIGGVAFILGWLALARWAWQNRKRTGDHRHD